MHTLKSKWAVLSFLVQFLFTGLSFGQQPGKMYAHFIDVGQAQSILLEFEKGAILIDAGATEDKEVHLLNYLEQFFYRRTDLNHTLNAVMITHQHIDHDFVLKQIMTHFKVLNYLDNGNHNARGSGKNQLWMQRHYQEYQTFYAHYQAEDILSMQPRKGLQNVHIDPVSGTTDPEITLLYSAFARKPDDWSQSDFKNENNQSLVIRVQFGAASFIFTGDLEEKGIATLIKSYSGTTLLNADVLQVGHHGAQNAITKAWLDAVTPKYAVISCGHWNDGRQPDGKPTRFTTYAYGHPNINALEMLALKIPGNREFPVTDTVGVKGSFRGSIPVFKATTITKNIYATPWDGDITIEADASGKYRIIK